MPHERLLTKLKDGAPHFSSFTSTISTHASAPMFVYLLTTPFSTAPSAIEMNAWFFTMTSISYKCGKRPGKWILRLESVMSLLSLAKKSQYPPPTFSMVNSSNRMNMPNAWVLNSPMTSLGANILIVSHPRLTKPQLSYIVISWAVHIKLKQSSTNVSSAQF